MTFYQSIDFSFDINPFLKTSYRFIFQYKFSFVDEHFNVLF